MRELGALCKNTLQKIDFRKKHPDPFYKFGPNVHWRPVTERRVDPSKKK